MPECLFWDCDVTVKSEHILCYDHYLELRDGLVDECLGCGLAKYAQYEVCLDCYNKPASRRARAKTSSRGIYEPEYSEAWEKGDADADEFFVYILKLSGGEF